MPEHHQGAGWNLLPDFVVGERGGDDHRDAVSGSGVIAEIDRYVLIGEVGSTERGLTDDVAQA